MNEIWNHNNLDNKSGYYTQALVKAGRVCERIRQWQTERGIEPEDPTQVLNQLREERDRKLVDRLVGR